MIGHRKKVQTNREFQNLWRSFHSCGRLKSAFVVELTELYIPFIVFDLKGLTYRSSLEIETFLFMVSINSEVYLEPCESMVEFVCDSSEQLLVVNYFRKKAPS